MPRFGALLSPAMPRQGSAGTPLGRLTTSVMRLTEVLLIEDLASNRIYALGRVGRRNYESVPETGPTWKQVAVTIASTVIGAGVLGLPFALSHAGWAGLLLLIVMTVVGALTAKMVVWSFTTVNTRKREHPETIGKGVRDW
jgi:VIT1/CCC1 family predicted Fe2+/Mn2+ transporter